jgi:hypothetical protein
MGINGQQMSLEMAAGTAQPPQGFLEGFGFGHTVSF